MRKHFILMALGAVAMMGAVSCTKQAPEVELEAPGMVVTWGDDLTKATALTREKNVTSLVIYVFEQVGSDWLLDVKHTCSAAQISAKAASFDVKAGAKHVWAIANLTGTALTACNSCLSENELKTVTFDLGANAPDSFVMVGSNITVNAAAGSTTNCPITLQRRVGKIALGTVTNNLPSSYGSMKVQKAFLGNVVGTSRIDGNAAGSITWLNQYATADGVAGHYIGSGSYTAQSPALTYQALGADPGDVIANGGNKAYPTTTDAGKYFFCGPNASTTAIDGFKSPFAPTYTALILIVNISGQDYSYPIALDHLVANNTDYVVNVTIKGLGNKFPDVDPFKPISKGTLNATITVSEWADGTPYTVSL